MESWLKLSVFEISCFYNYYDGYIRELTNERTSGQGPIRDDHDVTSRIAWWSDAINSTYRRQASASVSRASASRAWASLVSNASTVATTLGCGDDDGGASVEDVVVVSVMACAAVPGGGLGAVVVVGAPAEASLA